MTVNFVFSRRRKTSVSPDIEQMECTEEELDIEEEKGGEGGGGGGGGEGEIMDERMAAMVLTSLSCSPVSPGFHHHIIHNTEKATGEKFSFEQP
jgi:hypothetical protein